MEIYTKPYKSVNGIQADTTLYTPNGKVYRTITDDSEFKKEFNNSGFARANSIKKTKVSKNQQGGQIPPYVDYLQNFFKSFGNGSKKVINFLRKHAPIEYVVEPFLSRADIKGEPDIYMEVARKPTLGLKREVFHRYYPNGHFSADTTFRIPNGWYVSNKYDYGKEDYNKAKDMWEGRDTIPLRK